MPLPIERIRLDLIAMLRLTILLVSVAMLLPGCSSAPAADAPVKGATASVEPEKLLYESFRSARYQVEVAGDQLAAAVESTRELSKGQAEETRQALLEISDNLTQAGSKIADFAEELPTYDVFKTKFSEYDDERLQAIEACNEALKEIKEAHETNDDLLASEPPEPERTKLTEIADAIQEAQDALTDAIKSMQGSSGEEPVTSGS